MKAAIDAATVSLDGIWMIAIDPDNRGKKESLYPDGLSPGDQPGLRTIAPLR